MDANIGAKEILARSLMGMIIYFVVNCRFFQVYISSGNGRIIEHAPQITGGWIHACFMAFYAFQDLMEKQ